MSGLTVIAGILLIMVLLFFAFISDSSKPSKEKDNMGTPATELKKYIRDEQGNRIGVIIAGKSETDGVLRVGWSLISSAHPENPDTYNNYRAHQIACGRIDKQSSRIVPQRIKDEVIHMATRAGAYFKLDNVIISGIIVDDLDEYRRQVQQSRQPATYTSCDDV